MTSLRIPWAQRFLEAGATHIVLNIAAFYHQKEVIPRLLQEVIKPLKQSNERESA
jgi:hypothetical protein